MNSYLFFSNNIWPEVVKLLATRLKTIDKFHSKTGLIRWNVLGILLKYHVMKTNQIHVVQRFRNVHYIYYDHQTFLHTCKLLIVI